MQATAIAQRAIITGQRQHRDKVELAVVLSNILQRLHHGSRCQQVVARQARAVHHDAVTQIYPGLLAQNLAYCICPRAPGARYAKAFMADGAKHGIGNHVVRLLQHDFQQVMQRCRLRLGDHRARHAWLGLALQMAANLDP
ncbi:hypothetical protein D3C75_894410 [compost metagenome]